MVWCRTKKAVVVPLPSGKNKTNKTIPQTLPLSHKTILQTNCSFTPAFTLLSSALVVQTAVLPYSLLEILCTPVTSRPVLILSSATHSWSILPPLTSLPCMPLLRLTGSAWSVCSWTAPRDLGHKHLRSPTFQTLPSSEFRDLLHQNHVTIWKKASICRLLLYSELNSTL